MNGGDALYLCHWMRRSGLADLLPSLRETVWVGLSAGSMVMTPRIGEDFVGWKPPTSGDSALGIVDFSIFPHLDHEDLPENTMADAERWAAGIECPAYAIDDQTAIRVSDGAVEVVSCVIVGPSPASGWSRRRVGRHHLRDAGDRSRVLVRAGLDPRLSCSDERGLAVCRPHRAGRASRPTTVLTAKDVEG